MTASTAGAMTPIHVKGKKRKWTLDTEILDHPWSRNAPGFFPTREQDTAGIQTLSALEQLPVELLEEVLIESLNMDLPLVSRTLLAKLSRRSLFYRVFLNVLQDQDQGDPVVHTALFRRRFVSDRLFKEMEERQLLPVAKIGGLTPIQEYFGIVSRWNGKAGTYRGSVSASDVRTKAFFCAPGTLLPLRALRSTPESWILFRQAIYAGAGIDWKNTTTGEVATQILEECFERGETDGASCLLESGLLFEYKPDLLHLAMQRYLSEDYNIAMSGYYLILALADQFDDDLMEHAYLDPRLWKLAEERHLLERNTLFSHRHESTYILDLLTARGAIWDIPKPRFYNIETGLYLDTDSDEAEDMESFSDVSLLSSELS
jgi:hypothetical protein